CRDASLIVQAQRADRAMRCPVGDRDRTRFAFVFSSRRRHTSSKRDWSSDVCSSDLVYLVRAEGLGVEVDVTEGVVLSGEVARRKIGRASCRERGSTSGGGASVEARAERARGGRGRDGRGGRGGAGGARGGRADRGTG